MFSWVSFDSAPDFFADIAANWTPDGNNPRTRNKALSKVVKREKGGQIFDRFHKSRRNNNKSPHYL